MILLTQYNKRLNKDYILSEVVMSSGMLFVLALFSFVIVYFWLAFGNLKKAKSYFKTKTGKRVWGGIVWFILFGLLFVGVSEFARADKPGTWFSYGEVYLGVDWTFDDPSPQCVKQGGGGIDSRGTSNGGIRINIYESFDSRFHFNTKYTHHSCALNTDRNQYDAIGFEIQYRFFDR